MKIYFYLFYGFYTIVQKTAYRDIAGFIACVWLSAFIVTYVIGLISKANLNLLDYISSWGLATALLVPIMIVNYFLILKDGRYKVIIQHNYQNESNAEKIIRMAVTILFVVGAILTLIKF